MKMNRRFEYFYLTILLIVSLFLAYKFIIDKVIYTKTLFSVFAMGVVYLLIKFKK